MTSRRSGLRNSSGLTRFATGLMPASSRRSFSLLPLLPLPLPACPTPTSSPYPLRYPSCPLPAEACPDLCVDDVLPASWFLYWHIYEIATQKVHRWARIAGNLPSRQWPCRDQQVLIWNHAKKPAPRKTPKQPNKSNLLTGPPPPNLAVASV